MKPSRSLSAPTLASSAYGALRDDILTGAFPPGEKLRIQVLCERYGVGATPVREALNRLCAENLVVAEDQRGFRAAPLNIEDLFELTRTRCWINEIALRESLQRGDAAWEEEIVLALHRMNRHRRDSSRSAEAALHRAFHLSLVAACGSRWLIDFYSALIDCAERYRHFGGRRDDSDRDIAAEHQSIADVVLARDVSRAVELLNAHMTRTAEAIAQSVSQVGTQLAVTVETDR